MPGRWNTRSLVSKTQLPAIFQRTETDRDLLSLWPVFELAPLVGLADRIVDLVETGKTLKANHLVEEEIITWSSARLIVNRASLKMKHATVTEVITRIKKQVAKAKASNVAGKG